MNPKDFKGRNVIMGKDQKEYLPLPALYIDGNVITCWELDYDELDDVVRSRSIFLSQKTFGQPLQPLRVESGLDKLVETIRPPKGIKPEFLHIEERIDDIKKAMANYSSSAKPIPEKWTKELNHLLKRQSELQRDASI